ncbi:hypothetical protein ACA910_003118 [Epithemia clementina (nom. ined.)]
MLPTSGTVGGGKACGGCLGKEPEENLPILDLKKVIISTMDCLRPVTSDCKGATDAIKADEVESLEQEAVVVEEDFGCLPLLELVAMVVAPLQNVETELSLPH